MPRSFYTKWIIVGFVLLIIVAGACYLWYQYDTAPDRKAAADAEELLRQSEIAKKVSGTDSKTEQAADKASAESNTPTAEKPITDDVVGTTSSNPMFADGVPEHLHCPEEWIGMYAKTFKGDFHELGRIMQPRIDEILSKYNPHRPLTEVWPLFIAAEKSYYANADPELSDPGQARGRFDWEYQNLLDFPEVFVLNMTDMRLYPDRFELLRDVDHFETMRQVAIGHWDPDLNLHKLQDGRELRTRTGYRYEAIAENTGINAKGQFYYTSTQSGFSHSGKDAELIKIYLSETSDEELAQLGGWNYNIDPYATGMYTLPEDATERILERNRNAYGGLKK
ncbi:hypothetical protein C6501_02050 [Candidatus Poribacteria bacterium]|nr:MAG: hypothetical protein C6501_02050 [Candidatus Poribacteria bacterium]